jgi:ABC-type multidrug transport system ATPase subunit
MLEPEVLLVSQPTWGVDVGAAAQIRGELLALRDAGCAVLLVSEELNELFEISDRLMVMAQGRLSPSMPVADASGRADRCLDERPVGCPRRRERGGRACSSLSHAPPSTSLSADFCLARDGVARSR